jgi:hypothetical protein
MHPMLDLFLIVFHMYGKLICNLYAFLCWQNFILVKSGCYSSSRVMALTLVFLQELHEPSITRALAKANKVSESSQETPLLSETVTESPEVMKIHSNRRTPFMIYLRTWGLLEDKDECERLHHRVGHYTLLNDELFR